VRGSFRPRPSVPAAHTAESREAGSRAIVAPPDRRATFRAAMAELPWPSIIKPGHAGTRRTPATARKVPRKAASFLLPTKIHHPRMAWKVLRRYLDRLPAQASCRPGTSCGRRLSTSTRAASGLDREPLWLWSELEIPSDWLKRSTWLHSRVARKIDHHVAEAGGSSRDRRILKLDHQRWN
jgi:hypothetical protein